MARPPNYDFERKERERLKKLKKAESTETKLKRAAVEVESRTPDDGPTGE